MSEMKHTPGPWHVGNGGWVFADVPDGIMIAGAEDPYYGGFLVAESVSKANLPLIAAAPELLAELMTLERHARQYGGVPNSATKLWDRVRNLIEKAAGAEAQP